MWDRFRCEKGHIRFTAPLPDVLQGQGHGCANSGFQGVFRKDPGQSEKAVHPEAPKDHERKGAAENKSAQKGKDQGKEMRYSTDNAISQYPKLKTSL